MDYQEHVEAVARSGVGIVGALRKAQPDARVPSCPEWTLTELAKHVGEFTGFWTHVLCEGTGRPKTPFPEMPAGPQLASWYEELVGHLVTELGQAGPDTKVWTWAPDAQHAGFVARRCAHELTVHRYDAQLVDGNPDPIAPAVAADGIEEIIFMIGAHGPPEGCGNGETLHLHGTDAPAEWLLTFGPDGLAVERGHAKGDLALRGAVGDLELMAYHRPPAGIVEHHGDESVLDALYRAFTFG